MSHSWSRRSLAAAGFGAILAVVGLAQSSAVHAQAAAEAVDEPIFGSQLMTEQERTEHRAEMRSAKTAEERDKIRAEHHKQMVERAKQRGLTLPDPPPMRGMGRGPGPGQGAGRGPGPGPK